jgi:hypothetical protein
VAWSGVVAGCKVLFVVGAQWWVVGGRRRMAFTDGGGAKWCAGSPVGAAMPGIALTRRRRPGAGIAQILRTGWFRRVHVRSEASYLVRARWPRVRHWCASAARSTTRSGKAPGGLRKRAAEIAGDELAHQPELAQLVRMLLALRATLCDQIANLDRQLIRQARATRFMTVPGMGVVVALSVWSAIDDPGRFAKSQSVGAYLGLTLRRYASGEVDRQGRIIKRGGPVVRTHLYEAANVLDAHRPLFGTQGRRLQGGQGGGLPQTGRHPAGRERHPGRPRLPTTGCRPRREPLHPATTPDQATEPPDRRD